MKEIKFRGICNAGGEFHGKWVYGDLLQKNGKKYITPHANAVSVNGHLGKIIIMHEVDPETVGQYTPLKDKNGKEIYEGNIVKSPNGGIGIVEFHNSWGAFYYKTVIGKNEDGKLVRMHSSVPFWNDAPMFEVIGNIYEHPELVVVAAI